MPVGSCNSSAVHFSASLNSTSRNCQLKMRYSFQFRFHFTVSRVCSAAFIVHPNNQLEQRSFATFYLSHFRPISHATQFHTRAALFAAVFSCDNLSLGENYNNHIAHNTSQERRTRKVGENWRKLWDKDFQFVRCMAGRNWISSWLGYYDIGRSCLGK